MEAERAEPCPFCRLEASPTFEFPLSRIFVPSSNHRSRSDNVSFQTTAGSPTNRGASTRKTKKSERRSRRWSKSVDTESSSRVEASPG